MSQPANDEFSQHFSDDEESNHEDALDTGVAPKQQQQQQVIPQTTVVSNIKLPILKKEEYDIWAMEMEHYLEYIDNDVWKVIPNGNSKKRISTGKDGIVRILSPVTAAEIQAVEKERKAKNILLMANPKEHMRRFHGMDDAKEIWEAIRTRFGGNANSKKMQKAIFKQQFEAFKISSSEGLEKGYDRFQQLLSQLEAHGAKVSTKDANHKFLRSLPPAWSNLAMTMRTKPEVDTLSIDDLYNNLRVFEQEIQGASKTSSSAQNVAFVSQSKSSTNKVKSGFTGAYSTCTPSTSSTNIPEKEVLAGFADEVIYSLFAKQSEDWDLLHEDLEQIDDLDIEEMDINWQIAMIAIRMKKFYKKTGRRVRVDGKTPVGFDKKKLECFNCHNTGHFARECTAKGTHDGKKKRDSFYQHQEAGKQEKNQMGLLTMDDGIVNWGEHTEVEETNHALMAISSSNEVSLCSKTCIDSYNTLKTLCDEQMNQLGDQEAQILAYSQAVKKLEAQLVTFQKQQLSLNEKLTFQANEIYEKDEKLKRYRRIGMKAVKEKEQLQKTLDSWKDSSKNLWRLINSGMSSNSKVGLGFEIQSNNEVLSYEEEMNFSIFNCSKEDSVGKPLYSRFTKTNDFKGVPHPLSGDYTPTPQEEIDESLYVYGKKGPPVNILPVNLMTVKDLLELPLNILLTLNLRFQVYLQKYCDYYEKKMAREAEVKKQRVVNSGNGVENPVWTNANRVNHANKIVPRSVQINAGNKDQLEGLQNFNGDLLPFEVEGYISGKGRIRVVLKKKMNKDISIHSKQEETLTESQKDKKDSSTDSLEDNPKIQAFRRELEEIALKHLGTVPENNTTSTPSVNTGSQTVNTGRLDHDDSLMPELEIFHKPETGIFDEASYDEEGVITNFNSLPTEIEVSPTPTLRIHSIHLKNQILGDPKSAVQTRSKVQNKSGAHALLSHIQKQQRNNHKDQQHCLFACFLSQEEPKRIAEALQDDIWFKPIKEELLQFKLQQVCVLVDLPHGMKVIGTKWVYRNKRDERGMVVRNKARLVAQGYTQEEGLQVKQKQGRNLHITGQGGSNLDRKSITDGCQFLVQRLISWQVINRQLCRLLQLEAEYVAAAIGWFAEIVDLSLEFQPEDKNICCGSIQPSSSTPSSEVSQESEEVGRFLKRRNMVLSYSEEEEPEAQGRKSQDDPLDSSYRKDLKKFDTGAEQVNTAEGVSTGSTKLSTGSEQVSTVGDKKSTSSPDKGQRAGKAPMIIEETPKKSKNKFYKRKLALQKQLGWILCKKKRWLNNVHDSHPSTKDAEDEELE
ncbi:ribonuclease H-like domain-containing protein [Tanacetum coccineum]